MKPKNGIMFEAEYNQNSRFALGLILARGLLGAICWCTFGVPSGEVAQDRIIRVIKPRDNCIFLGISLCFKSFEESKVAPSMTRKSKKAALGLEGY